MFSVLPFALSCQLGILPVEMWSTILRYLDLKSLLSTARSHKLWLSICRGDPVLRQRLHLALMEEKKHIYNMYINPRLSTSVSRKVPSKQYGMNVQKFVSNCDNKDLSALFEKLPLHKTTEGRNPAKRTNKKFYGKRFSPYRL